MILETERLILPHGRKVMLMIYFNMPVLPEVGSDAGWPVHTIENSREIIKSVFQHLTIHTLSF